MQLEYILKQLRWGKVVANDFLTTLDYAQMRSSLVAPLLENIQPAVEYLGNSYIMSIRKRLDEMGGSMWIEDCWTPKLQREGDRSLMEVFISISWITKRMLEKVNEVRLYLRVVTIADLADEEGDFIPDGMLCGDWQKGSDLKWLRQRMPEKKS